MPRFTYLFIISKLFQRLLRQQKYNDIVGDDDDKIIDSFILQIQFRGIKF